MPDFPEKPEYSVTLADANGNEYDASDFVSLQYSHSLNQGSQATLEIPMKSQAVTALSTSTRLAELYVRRTDSAGSATRLIWYGKLMQTSYSGDYNDARMTLVFESLASLLAYRYTSSTYSVTSATDTSTIMEDILTTTQAMTGGNLGITTGSLTASKNRTAEEELKDRSVLSIFESYAEVLDGVDWVISPTLQNFTQGEFNTYFRGTGEKYHKGTVKDVPLVFKVDDTNYDYGNNVETFQITERGQDYANSIRVKGATVEDTQLSATSTDATAITAYGLFEKLAQFNDVSEQDTLDDRADEILNTTRNIPYDISVSLIPHVEPRVTTFDVGDIFNFQFKYYNAREYTRQYRVYEVTISIGEDGVENIDMGLNIV